VFLVRRMMPLRIAAKLRRLRATDQCRGFSMKWLKRLLGVVLVLVLVLVGVGFLLPSTFGISRSTLVNAPPDKLYPLVANPRHWNHWAVWNQRDPAMKITYSGAESGTGAVWAWQSKTQGDGRMSFTAAEPGKRLAYDLYFPDFGTTSTGELRFAAEGQATRVTWVMKGDFGPNPLYHWFGLFSEQMMGPDFEGGLANLKALAEKP